MSKFVRSGMPSESSIMRTGTTEASITIDHTTVSAPDTRAADFASTPSTPSPQVVDSA